MSDEALKVLRSALRNEMFSVLNDGELTPETCSTLIRLAEASRDILSARLPRLSFEPSGGPSLHARETLNESFRRLPHAAHVGKAIDAKGYCEISDCWCRYCIDPLTSTRGVMVRSLGVDFEAFKAPDGTVVNADGFIIEPGHPQEGVLWSMCQGGDPNWTPSPGWKLPRPRWVEKRTEP